VKSIAYADAIEVHPSLASNWDRAKQIHQTPLPATIPQYEQFRVQLANIHRIDEAADIKDKAEALRAYARIRHDTEAECQLAEIKLRAFRRIGELSRKLEKFPGRPGKKSCQRREEL
jgi:hypothetical protein